MLRRGGGHGRWNSLGRRGDGIHLDGGGKEKKVIPVALCSGKVITILIRKHIS